MDDRLLTEITFDPEPLLAARYARSNPFDRLPGVENDDRLALERWIYFVQGDDAGPIKIGRTYNHPAARIAALQPGYPFGRLRLVGVVRATAPHETEVHRQFKHLRLIGEWFRAETDLLMFVRSLPAAD